MPRATFRLCPAGIIREEDAEENRRVTTPIMTDGISNPDNLETARASEAAVRAAGAVPATVAVFKGQVRIGLTAAELEALYADEGPCSRKLCFENGPRKKG